MEGLQTMKHATFPLLKGWKKKKIWCQWYWGLHQLITYGWVQAKYGLMWCVSDNENMEKKSLLTWRDDSRYFHNEFEYGVKRWNVGK